MNEPEQAKAPLRRALALQPDLAVSWNRLGTTHARTGEFEQALSCHQRAVDSEPDNNRLKADLASCLADSGNLQGAVDAYHKLQQLEPDNLDDRKDLAMVLLKKGDFVAGWEEAAVTVVSNRGIGRNLNPAAAADPGCRYRLPIRDGQPRSLATAKRGELRPRERRILQGR
jgi:Flp pilus assembly protein TadD